MDLSPFSRLIRDAVPNDLLVQLLCTIPLAYICACSYFALFHLTALDYNKLLPRATKGAALMQVCGRHAAAGAGAGAVLVLVLVLVLTCDM
jgi:hypothetical protein